MDIAGLTGVYAYIILFIGMFVLGETVFLPAVYLSINNQLDPILVLVISIAANLISDIIWYYVSGHVPIEKIKGWKRVRTHEHTFSRLSVLFDAHMYRILFLSKFVYGTRIFVQVLAGIKKMPFWKYLAINTLGVVAYMLLLYAIAIAVDATLARYLVDSFKFGITGFIVLAVIINLCIHFIAKRKWSL